MSMDRPPYFRVRLSIFLALCVLSLAWNMALSSRRRNYSGKLTQAKQINLDIKVTCLGKIEPKVEEILRSQLDGPKKAVFVKEGDTVKQGQLLMEIGDDQIRPELNSKKAAFRNAKVDYSKAAQEYEFSKRLYRQLAIPKREVETAQQALDRAAQALSAAQEELAALEKKAAGMKVVSPISGVVLKVYIEEESSVVSGKELIKVAQIDRFIVRGRVDELEISQVALGQKAQILCDAFSGVEMKGVVGWIGAQAADSSFPEVPVVLDIIDTKGLNLKANLTADAKIYVKSIPNAIVIPEAALHRSESGHYVLKTGWGGWLYEQPVDVELVNSSQAVIQKGLQATDTVLVPPVEN